jgi:hypothetical protein
MLLYDRTLDLFMLKIRILFRVNPGKFQFNQNALISPMQKTGSVGKSIIEVMFIFRNNYLIQFKVFFISA